MGILPCLRRILKDSVQVWHPKEEIGVLANQETVKYVVTAQTVKVAGHQERQYSCKLFVGKWEVVEVKGGSGSEEVKTMAAERAVKILKAKKEKSDIDNMVHEM